MGGSKMSNNQAMLEYLVNKFLPYGLLIYLLVLNIELTNYFLYVIVGLIIFIDKFSFKIGRSVGEYENNILFRKRVDKKVDKKE